MTTREVIIDALMSTERSGIEDLIVYMGKSGFFEAPCSGGHHLCCEGGLAQHSLNVYQYACKVAFMMWGNEKFTKEREHITIAALLHDLGKSGQYGKKYYVKNMVKDGRPTKAEPEQKYKQSDSKPYEVNKELLHIDHNIRSVAIASMFIDLTEEEQHAILYHDGLYGSMKYEYSGHETELSEIIHFADFWVSHFLEGKDV